MKIETFRLSLAVALAIGLSPAVANGQQQNQANTTAVHPRGEMSIAQGSSKTLARLFATELALANHCEMQLAQMASDKTKSQQLKEYAQTLIRDHQQLNRDLVRLFPEIEKIQGMKADAQAKLGDVNSASATRRRDDSSNGQVARSAETGAMQTNDVAMHLVQICVEASNLQYEMSREMLEQYQGEDLEMAFVGQQLACHVAMVAQLQAINNSKVETEDLQPVLLKAEEAARQHLELAKQLCKRLKSNGTTKNTQGGGNR